MNIQVYIYKMAYLPVTQAVAKVVLDAKMSVVKDVIKFLGTKMEIDEDMKNWMSEFTDNLNEEETKEMREIIKTARKKSKKIREENGELKKIIRPPSVYNLYVKDMMPSFKENNKNINDGRQLMRMLGEQWKINPMAKFLNEKVINLLSNNKELSVNDAYNQAKEEWNKNNLSIEVLEDKHNDLLNKVLENNSLPLKVVKTNVKKTKKKSNKVVEESDNE